jgi:sugar lactone lactonase YvrE
VTPPEGRVAAGLSFDRRSGLLFVSGGPTGMAFVYDPQTGESVASYELTTEASFVNDVVVTREAAYFTDSFRPFIYRVPLGAQGELPDAGAVEEIELTGDFVFVPGGFNANGIEALANGKALIVVNSARGELYRVDPATGEAALIDLEGGAVPAGDGILLQGKRLYVVQNQLNQIAVVQLSPDFSSGEITETITDPAFRVPTTIASFGHYLYAVRALS